MSPRNCCVCGLKEQRQEGNRVLFAQFPLDPTRFRYGDYERVFPLETTPSRIVPDHIIKPEYADTGIPRNIPENKIEIKDSHQIQGMRKSCYLAATILSQVNDFIKPGVTTDSIDEVVHNLSIQAGAYPSPLNYKGFPKSVCTSVNNVAVHGIPDLRPLRNGDIVNVDITVFLHGYHGDCSKTYLVGDVDDRAKELIKLTEECLSLGIKTCGPDVPFSHIGATIKKFVRRKGLTVLPAFVGHGIGSYFHGPPCIYHTLNRYPGVMKAGMTFTIEPVLSQGSEQTWLLDDGWTVVTADGARTAQAEHTILINQDGSEILTKLD